MSAKENIEVLKRQTEEVWIQKDPSKLSQFYVDPTQMQDGEERSLDEVAKWMSDYFADSSVSDVVKVDYHEILGEGDTVMARQTNHLSDGSSVEGVTVAKFRDGKIVANLWYGMPDMSGFRAQ